VQRFYNQRRAQLKTVQPNAGHIALAELEKKWKHDFLLVTQNVDDLHERAGSKNLIHMHGDLLTKRCTNSGLTYACHDDLCGTDFRPHIVWFGEMPLEMERIYDAIANADLFLSIGTSGNVYPAAGFVQSAKMAGAQTVEINLEATPSPYFDRRITGKAGEILPYFIKELL
jgi:NAD-dependent deacetylase